MKVICINVDKTNDHNIKDLPHPEIGEAVTVVDQSRAYCRDYYQLQEYPEYLGKIVWYDARNFIEVSDLDETALVNEEWEEKVCEPVNSESCV